MLRSMMGFASLPISFQGYALESTCYVLNMVPSKFVAKTSYEIWTGRKPMLSHLRVQGCLAYVKRLLTDKLGPRSDKCLFVGYSKESKEYYFYHKISESNRSAFISKAAQKVLYFNRSSFYNQIHSRIQLIKYRRKFFLAICLFKKCQF